jgi:hypothetical protein
MEAVLDPGTVILDEISTLEVERARIEARIATKTLEFQDLRRRQAESEPDPTRRSLLVSFAADELSVALHLPTRTVQCRLAEARRVRGLLPQTWSAFRRGEFDTYRVSLIASAAAKLTDKYALIQLDFEVGGKASKQTPSQLKGWLKRFVARNTMDNGAKAEHAKRSVWVVHQDDGMSLLQAYIPTPEAVRIDHLLGAEAKKLASDDRTLEQKRADVFCDRILAGAGKGSGRSAVIAVHVPVTTLAGLSDLPGESFDGRFALPGDMVRDLARQPGTLFHRILTDPLGRILDVTEIGYVPSAKLQIAVQARDGTCSMPTCNRPAVECDIDHEIPHPRGPTSGHNLRPLCRRHHNIKTHRIAEPTDLAIRRRTPSRMEYDLARDLATIEYAA